MENYTGVILQPSAHTRAAWPTPTGLSTGRRRAGIGRVLQATTGNVAGGKAPLAHDLELVLGGHLLGEEGGLNAVEQPLEPSHELGLGHPQLGFARCLPLAQRKGQTAQLIAQVR